MGAASKKKEEAAARWYEAVRRGPIYCAPFCGAGCTWAAHQRAVQLAHETCMRLGGGWKPVVWENMGWHARAVGAEGHLHVFIHTHRAHLYNYSAMMNETDTSGSGHWHADATTPEEAVRAVVAQFKEHRALVEKLYAALGEKLTKVQV